MNLISLCSLLVSPKGFSNVMVLLGCFNKSWSHAGIITWLFFKEKKKLVQKTDRVFKSTLRETTDMEISKICTGLFVSKPHLKTPPKVAIWVPEKQCRRISVSLKSSGNKCYSKLFLNHCSHWPVNSIFEFSREQSQTSAFRLQNPRSDFGLALTFPEAKLSSCRTHLKSQWWLSLSRF